MRPANILTAIADILGGFAISGSVAEIYHVGHGWFYIPEASKLCWLVLSTIGLYGGGVVLNDFFDAELDKTERPERPIPSGRASKTGAGILGLSLLILGIIAASFVSLISAGIAVIVAGLAVLYDAWGKHQTWFGPFNMGLCRGFNLLLGISAVASALASDGFIAMIPVMYIAAITMVSRGEVHGQNSHWLKTASGLYAVVLLSIGALAVLPYFHLRSSLVFLTLFAWMIYLPLRKAQRTGEARDIGRAVKFGVLGLILMDAALAAGFLGWDYALLVVCLLPVSILLAKVFAVT
jgi:4-hydroxybenzoate polyprenyltransferase